MNEQEIKITPGPWHYSQYRASIRQDRKDGKLVGIFHDGKGMSVKQEDARLIAAAPELLKAIKELVSEIRAYQSPECDDEGAIGAEELKAADAAIEKAEGKCP